MTATTGPQTTERRGAHRAAPAVATPTVREAIEQVARLVDAPDLETEVRDGRINVGGRWLLLPEPYAALKAIATDPDAGRWRRRRATKALQAETDLHRQVIEYLRVSGGFDIEAPAFTPRGYKGAGGGRMRSIGKLPEYRGTTTQVGGGMFPWCFGANSPILGTQLGYHAQTGADFAFDPLNWFLESDMTSPILFVIALNGYGKSTLVREICMGLIAQGLTCIFPDTKPDYLGLTRLVDGLETTLSYGRDTINPLDIGGLGRLLPRLRAHADELRAAMAHLTGDELSDAAEAVAAVEEKIVVVTAGCRARQVAAVVNLIELKRKKTHVSDFEETLITVALELLYETRGFTEVNPPIIQDVYDIIEKSPPELWPDAAADDLKQFRKRTVELRQSLRGLCRGPFGKVFNAPTSTPLNIDTPAFCIDLSRIPEGDETLLAAVLLTSWSDAFGAIESAHVLADVGLAPKRQFVVVMDEFWRILRAGRAMIDRVDALTRLNRKDGVVLIMITHTIKDLASFDSKADVNKALGFIERAQVKIIGPVGKKEVSMLSDVASFTDTDRARIASFAAAATPSTKVLIKRRQEHDKRVADALAAGEIPPDRAIHVAEGTGRYMLKMSTGGKEEPGTPFVVTLSQHAVRTKIHDTNAAFNMRPTRAQITVDGDVVAGSESLL